MEKFLKIMLVLLVACLVFFLITAFYYFGWNYLVKDMVHYVFGIKTQDCTWLQAFVFTCLVSIVRLSFISISSTESK